jgi:DNA-binding protein H-NS
MLQFVTNRTFAEDLMTKINLEKMSLDELWHLHEEISDILSNLILAEKRELEKRLAQLNREKGSAKSPVVELREAGQRKRYPRVLPKYQNPQVPTETWSGRGKQPRWLVSALKSGGNIEDFRISEFTLTKIASAR